jgi:hypothetical protein
MGQTIFSEADFHFIVTNLDTWKDFTDGWQIGLNHPAWRVFVDQNQVPDLCFCSQLCYGASITVIDGRRDVDPVIRQVNFTLPFSPKICTALISPGRIDFSQHS